MPADLTEVSTEALMAEIQRRLDCTKKPEKRIILIGGWSRLGSPPGSIDHRAGSGI